MKNFTAFLLLLSLLTIISACKYDSSSRKVKQEKSPNILFVISDDQSFAHTGFSGCDFVHTPGFDRIAKEGIFFTNCYAGSPGCAPSRSALVTGRHHWQNEQSGQHGSSWMKKHVPFIDLLDQNGYYTGRTGKGVAPFRYARDENDSLWRVINAAGIEHSSISYKIDENDERYAADIASVNYFENFKYFMENRKQGSPFFFWYGSQEPHRAYELDSWKRHGKSLEEAEVPGFLPDDDLIRRDLLDYAVEIDWFDLHLVRMLDYLEEIGELDNTIVIVTSDNGMPFPRAKANGYDYGIHVPLAIRYPEGFPGGRVVDDLLGFIDFAPTILELTGTTSEGMLPISGKSFANILYSRKSGVVEPSRDKVFIGRERHSSSRYNNQGYPQRVIRSGDHLLIWNIEYDLWPAGDPQRIDPANSDLLLPMYGIDERGKHHSEWAFTDVDAAPSKSFIIENMEQGEIRPFFELAYEKRPEFELYDLKNDPLCIHNLSGKSEYSDVEERLRIALMEELSKTGDPRVIGPDKEIFDSYIRYMPIREFPMPKEIRRFQAP